MIENIHRPLLAAGLMLAVVFPVAQAEPGRGYTGGPAMSGAGDRPAPGRREPGHAARGFGLIHSLDLSDEQRARVRKIEGDLRRGTWDALGKVQDDKERLRELFDASPRDAKAIGAAYGAMFAHQRQIIEASVEALNRAEAVLTDAQRQELRQLRRGGPGAMRPGDGPRPHGPGPMGGPGMGGPGPYGPPQ